jgi:hypothetical protein
VYSDSHPHYGAASFLDCMESFYPFNPRNLAMGQYQLDSIAVDGQSWFNTTAFFTDPILSFFPT